jgi:hypothetical protein
MAAVTGSLRGDKGENMALQEDLEANVNNDAVFVLQLTTDELQTACDLAGYTSITAYLKASQTASDGSAVTFGVGSGIVVNNEVTGSITWTVPHTDLTTAGSLWYRIDVLSNSLTVSFLEGNFTVLAA